tara:strand:+ start:1454 stop:1627 length:174 start_codon:yes stop_codon:yes gene_type:complete
MLAKLIILKLFINISFGELEISNFTFAVLIALTCFTFLAVGISSFKLVQSATDDEDE